MAGAQIARIGRGGYLGVMHFPAPLVRGTLLRRYKRFLADVALPGGETVTAHVPNSGSMLGVDMPGLEAWLSRADNPKRKLPYTLEMVRLPSGLVGVNTMHPNRIAEAAVGDGAIGELAGYASVRREVKYGRSSRIDLLLEDEHRPPCYVEVKNVHMKRDEDPASGAAEFPDAVTARGAKHLEEMTAMVAQGARTVMLYLVQRSDCDRFRVAADIDPGYDEALRRAMDAGVEAICYACRLDERGIVIDRPLPVER